MKTIYNNTKNKQKAYQPTAVIKLTNNDISAVKTGYKRFSSYKEVKDFTGKYSLWVNTLSSDEFLSIISYTRDEYDNINAVLRGYDKSFNRDNKKHSICLHQALKKSPIHENITVYRGASKLALGAYADMKPEHLVGKVIRDKGFMSTTLLCEGVPSDDITLIIKVPKGTFGAPVSNISCYKTEAELLLDKDQQMVITNVLDNGKQIVCEII